MCDTTTLISAKQTDLHSCFIIYTKSDGRERLTVTNAKSMISNSKSDTNSNTGNIIDRSSSAEDSALDEDDNDGTEQSFHELLGPELQPEQPISDNEESQKIYREHQRLAKEYLRVDTSLYYAQDFKVKMLEQMNPTERVEKEEILSKMSDKEGLLEFYNNLRQQLENLHTGSDSAEVELPNANVVTSATTMTTNTPVPTQQQHPAITHRRMSQESISSASNEIADDGWVVVAPNSST